MAAYKIEQCIGEYPNKIEISFVLDELPTDVEHKNIVEAINSLASVVESHMKKEKS